jgi:hypothetical protein
MCYDDTFQTLYSLELALTLDAGTLRTGEGGMEVFTARWNKTLEYHFPCVPSCQQWVRLVSFCGSSTLLKFHFLRWQRYSSGPQPTRYKNEHRTVAGRNEQHPCTVADWSVMCQRHPRSGA